MLPPDLRLVNAVERCVVWYQSWTGACVSVILGTLAGLYAVMWLVHCLNGSWLYNMGILLVTVIYPIAVSLNPRLRLAQRLADESGLIVTCPLKYLRFGFWMRMALLGVAVIVTVSVVFCFSVLHGSALQMVCGLIAEACFLACSYVSDCDVHPRTGSKLKDLFKARPKLVQVRA